MEMVKTYTGASDSAKLTRLLASNSKSKNNVQYSGKKYTYIAESEHIKEGVTVFTTKSTHYLYVNNNEQFINSLKLINKLGKNSTFNHKSDEEFEHIQTLNNGVVVKETTRIIGIKL